MRVLEPRTGAPDECGLGACDKPESTNSPALNRSADREWKSQIGGQFQDHGLSTGVLIVKPEDRSEFEASERALIEESKPEGALEMDVIREFRDAGWRLRQIRQITKQLFVQHSEDPFTNPECQAAMRQLNRYRAAAEMSLHRALSTLRELQTVRLGRIIHLTKSENEAIGPLVAPKVFAFMSIEAPQMNRFNATVSTHFTA